MDMERQRTLKNSMVQYLDTSPIYKIYKYHAQDNSGIYLI